MVILNDNDDNLGISGVCGWDFNFITSKVFVTCVRQLNTLFIYLFFFFLYVIEVVPRKNSFRRCPQKKKKHVNLCPWKVG